MTNEAKLADFFMLSCHFSELPAYEYNEHLGMQGMLNREYIPMFSKLYRGYAKRALEEFYENYFADKDYTHWGDKMVSLSSAADLRAAWPDMKFVVIVRDARDVACSLLKYLQRPGVKETHGEIVGYSARQHAEVWRKTYQEVLDYVDEFHTVRYEDVMADRFGEVEKILDYLGLEMDDAVRAAIDSNNTFKGHGTSTSVESSMGKWQSELPAEEIRAIDESCGSLFDRFGYPRMS